MTAEHLVEILWVLIAPFERGVLPSVLTSSGLRSDVQTFASALVVDLNR